jgi:hypothetical protein
MYVWKLIAVYLITIITALVAAIICASRDSNNGNKAP